MLTRATPAELVRRSLLGAVICTASLPLTLVCIYYKHLWLKAVPAVWMLLTIAVLTPLVTGGFLTYSNEKTLRSGILNDRWSDAALTEARLWLNKPSVRTTVTGYLVGMIALMLGLTLSHHRAFGSLGGFVYLMILPGITLSRLKQHVAAPSQPASRLWSDSAQLHSSHWGN